MSSRMTTIHQQVAYGICCGSGKEMKRFGHVLMEIEELACAFCWICEQIAEFSMHRSRTWDTKLTTAPGFHFYHPSYAAEVMEEFGSRVEGTNIEIALVAGGNSARKAVQTICMLITPLHACATLLTSYGCIGVLKITYRHVEKEEWSDSCTWLRR